MQIAIIGSHGSGKTTFCRKLRDALNQFSEVMTIPDIARFSPKPVGAVSSVDAQSWILERQLMLEQLTLGSHKIILLDNCSAGHLAYFAYWGGTTDLYKSRTSEILSGINHIFFLPPQTRFLIHDGLRPISPDFQSAIAERQLAILKNAGVKFTILPETWAEWSDPEWVQFSSTLANASPNEKRGDESLFLVVVGRIRRNGSVLLNKRHTPQIPAADGKWELPGGRICFGEDPARCAEREILEETGYLVRAKCLLPLVQSNIWTRLDGKTQQAIVLCYACELLIDHQLPVGEDDEAKEPKWFSSTDALNLNLLSGIREFLEC